MRAAWNGPFATLRRLAPLVLVLVASASSSAQTLNGFDLRGAAIPVAAIERGGPPRDGIPSIDNPRFVPAAQAGLKDGDRVLGISRGGHARAYLVRILNWHEVVNDRIDGLGLTVTYCPLCGTGMAFEARVAGQEMIFGISGLLYNSDVLLYDRVTDSLWSQLLERAVTGPLKGTPLKTVPLVHTSWADWRSRHPGTVVLSTETGFARDCARDPYAGYDKIPRLMFEVQHRDERLPLKEWVLGLRVGGTAKAYPFSVLAQRVDASGRLRDRVEGQDLEIRYSREHRSAEAFDGSGQPIPSVMAFWFAWFAFHPQTQVLATTGAATQGR